MKNQEIISEMNNTITGLEGKVSEKVVWKVVKKIISKTVLVLGVTAATISFLMLIFEAIILFVDISEGVNIIDIIDKSIPVAVIFIITMIIHGICLEIYRKVRV